jgi:hypothetical protein
MSIKDLFGKKSNSIVTSQQLQNLYDEAESEGFLVEKTKENERFLPTVDFLTASNFARYGSAEKYYSDAIKNIYQTYPYDGSSKEKTQWRNDSSQLDLYVFDHIYPKTTGFVSLDANYSQYITVKGGPNTGSSGKFKDANLYDPSKNRESNLAINPLNLGNTVEFWYKETGLNSSTYPLFDLWNGEASGSAGYTRFLIEKVSTGFRITYCSGTSGVENAVINYSVDTSNWHHYSFIASPAGNKTGIGLCVDGDFKSRFVTGSGINQIANNANSIANIGAYRLGTPVYINAAFDEFRFWKEVRDSKKISRYWFTNVNGGSNTDDSNTELGVYFKFNEGIISTESINQYDAQCLDYSGRVSNGTIVNYNISVRSTGSAIEQYSSDFEEKKDPIIYFSNPLVQNVITEYSQIGFEHDQINNSSIYKSIPSWITEQQEDASNEDLANLTQIISSYFDTLHLQIENLTKIKEVKYVSEDEKPLPFINKILSSYNFENLEIFNNTTFLEELLSRNETDEFENSLFDIKNTIYQNIYNNLIYIYKSKGTEKSLRNLIRCFGVDDELVKINLYADNAQYDLTNKYQYVSIPKKFVDFNDADRYESVVYQKSISGDSDTRGYIKGNTDGKLDYIPITLQAEVIFPKKVEYDNPNYIIPEFNTVSLFGAHTADDNGSILNWNNDEFNFQVYAEKRNYESKDVYFRLTGSFSGSGFQLATDWFNEAYENNKWNLAVRVRPEKDGNVNLISGSTTGDYILEFVGFNTTLDNIDESFVLSTTIPEANAKAALSKNKRVYAGAHYQNFDPLQLLAKTDVKISSVRFWLDYLSDEELKNHSFDSSNYGREYPHWNAYLAQIDANNLMLTKADTLALNWDFALVTSSNPSGQFVVEDASSGSIASSTKYGVDWLGDILFYRHTGLGTEFYPNDSQVVNKEFVFSAKLQTPETLAGSDLIQIRNTDDVASTRNTKPVTYFYSIEKSMSQVINSEIINWFSTINAFNNLIGEPAERYRREYKNLSHLRKLFFEKVQNEPSFERFIEFYKWIDSSISMMISQLVPASANISENVRNVVESHLLERNKYENKLPTVETKGDIVSYVANDRQFGNFMDQIAPNNPTGSNWLKLRAERTHPLVSSGDPNVDYSREQIRKVLIGKNLNKVPSQYDTKTGQFYEGKSDIVRGYSSVLSATSSLIESPEAHIQPINIENNQLVSTFEFSSGSRTQVTSSTNEVDVSTLVASWSYYITSWADPALSSSYFAFANPYLVTPNDISSDFKTPYSSSLYGEAQPFVTTGSFFIDIYATGSYLETTYITTSIDYGELLGKTKKIGNYKNTYEYFQTSGRSKVNLKLPEIINQITESSDSLPVRPVVKSVIVERFSAPGGAEVMSRGNLDATAEEFSVYNEINSRNSVVRKRLNLWSAETSSLDSGNPSYHKINKNTGYSVDENGNANPQYDNLFIQHQIPRSDAQYSWITASLISKPSASGYFTDYDNLDIYNTGSAQFLSASISGGQILDYVGLNTNIQVEPNINTNTLSTSNTDDLNKYLLNINGPYGNASWKQIRQSSNKIVNLSRKNNKLLVQDRPKQKTKIEKGVLKFYTPKKSDTFTSYIEPPIAYNLPITHVVAVTGSTLPIEIVSTYENNKEKLANQALAKTLGVKDRTEPQTHDVLRNLESGVYEPKPEIQRIEYSENIYPADKNVSLGSIRTRPSYDDNGSTENIINTRTFWRDESAQRVTSLVDLYDYVTTSLGTVQDIAFYPYNKTSGQAFYLLSDDKKSIWSLDSQQSASVTKIDSTNTCVLTSSNTNGYLSKRDLSTEAYFITNQISPFPLLNSAIYNITDNNIVDLGGGTYNMVGYTMNNLNSFDSVHYEYYNSPSVLNILSASDGVYLAGNFSVQQTSYSNFFTKWNGEEFVSIGSYLNSIQTNVYDDYVSSIVSASNGIYAAGRITFWNYSGYSNYNIALWNGSSWNASVGASLKSYDSYFDYIYCLLSAGGNNLYALGYDSTNNKNKALYYNGSSWTSIFSSSISYPFIAAERFQRNSCISSSSGLYFGTGNAVKKYSGTPNITSSIGTPLNGAVRSIVSASDGLYIGGSFTSTGSYILKYNGSAFTAFSDQLNGPVYSMISHSSGLIVGGDFTATTSGKSLNKIGLWDGSSWKQFGRENIFNGFLKTDKVYCMSLQGSNVYVGGSIAGTKSGEKIKILGNVEVYLPTGSILTPEPLYVYDNFIPPVSGNVTVYENTYDANNEVNTTNVTSSGIIYNLNEGYIYETDQKASKSPFFDSYEKFAEDIKPHSQKYSLIPEYVISDFIEQYIKEKNGDFRSILTTEYLKLKGTTHTDFQNINNSMNISNVFDVSLASTNIIKDNKINIKVSALKKLLPYRGFYPSERIVTLGKYFIESFLRPNNQINSVSTNYQNYSLYSNGTPVQQQILTLLQPLFAPGVLLNTIKSSVAVDFPVFITSSVLYESTTPPVFYNHTGSSLIASDYTASNYIDVEPNFRLPFESLVDFDAVIPSILKKSTNNLYYLNPTHYTTDVTGVIANYTLPEKVYPSYNMGTGSGKLFEFIDPNYKLAMHNFLAEIPNFFLKGKLTNITSVPDNQFEMAVSGTRYYMDVVLERSPTYKEFIADPYYEALKQDYQNHEDGKFLIPSPDSLYGPPVRYWNNVSASSLFASGPYNLYSKLLDTPAYAPYVPPYYYGKSIARISFLATENKVYKLSEILKLANYEFINEESDAIFDEKSGYLVGSYAGRPASPNYLNTPAYKQRMMLSSSINLKMKAEVKDTTQDASTTSTKEIFDSTNQKFRWSIQTKFETPSINFANVDYDNVGYSQIGGTSPSVTGNVKGKGFYKNLFKGLWTTYGEPVKDGEGIKMYLQESYPVDGLTGSLVSMCGFSTDKKTIGVLAGEKKVSEAIVLIPFTENKNHANEFDASYAETLPELLGENNKTLNNKISTGPYYFKIDKDTLKNATTILFDKNRPQESEEIQKIVNSNTVNSNNSMVDLVKQMSNYVLPPHLDWVRNKSIDPFVMYIIPFETALDQEDLSDIWQGLMPKPSLKMEKEEKTFSHKIGENELFHGKKLPPDLRFKAFKVKQRANINYYKLTDDSKDDARFKFKFSNSKEATIPEYSYNYPYDFFSLVEGINVEATIETEKPSAPEEVTINPNKVLEAIENKATLASLKKKIGK